MIGLLTFMSEKIGSTTCRIWPYPVNIRNIFKWFKRLQNVFKTYLNPILWFSKHFQVYIYAVMLKKNIYKNSLYKQFYWKRLLNVYKITQEARFDWKHVLNFYNIAKEMKVMLEMFLKHSS